MLILIKLTFIIVLVIFFRSGKKVGENGIRWAVIGAVGYMLVFALTMTIIGETFIAITLSCLAVYFVRARLLIPHQTLD